MASAEEREVQLSAVERELLQRAREQRDAEVVPDALRRRMLQRALEDEAGGERGLTGTVAGAGSAAVAATELVVVPAWSWRSTVQWLSAAACVVLMLFGARQLLWSWLDTRKPQAESRPRSGASAAERLLDAPLFRSPAAVLPAGQAPPASASLFPEQPFSVHSAAWQVRRWDDLSVAPAGAATHEFSAGALCVPLAAGQRVLGGWPWAAADGVVPRGVPLAAGRPYRLYLKAWAEEPLPAQLLVGVGHARLPFSAAAGARIAVTAEPQTFVIDFSSANGDPSAGIAFLATARREAEPTRVCVSDVVLVER